MNWKYFNRCCWLLSFGYNGISTNCREMHLHGLHDKSYACIRKFTIPGKPGFVAGTKISYRDTDQISNDLKM